MALEYARDDGRRLITVTATPSSEPLTLDDILAVIDRQAAENTWEYSILYDFRQIKNPPTSEHMQAAVDHIQVVGAHRRRGPVGVILPSPTPPEMFRKSLVYAQMTSGLLNFEVLLTDNQIKDWLARYATG